MQLRQEVLPAFLDLQIAPAVTGGVEGRGDHSAGGSRHSSSSPVWYCAAKCARSWPRCGQNRPPVFSHRRHLRPFTSVAWIARVKN